ncbi:Putative phage integrase [Duganella sacchari]|uniref:Putative phage integrase n=1 Tax=Duganella sacchari TaxID=551987 RepID=A0A1M7R5D9_9BURK|nr:VPA1269 family protein [Duganella sacchari]SHN40522.1 Putative phage integrase [Duganella sacchari]
MNSPLKTCIVEPGLEISTRHRQTRIIENLSTDRFLIPPTWTAAACSAALSDWISTAKGTEESTKILEPAKQLEACRTRKHFAEKLDTQLTAAFVGKSCGPIKPLQKIYHHLLVALWNRGCLIWPAETSVCGWPPEHTALPWGASNELVENIVQGLTETKSQRGTHRCRRFMRLLLSRSSIDNILDLTPRSDSKLLSDSPARQDSSAVAKLIVILQRQAPAPIILKHFEPSDFTHGGKPKPGSRSDPEFRWVTQKDHRWDKWRMLATEYLSLLRRGRNIATHALNTFLDYASEHELPYDPKELFLNTKAANYPAFPSARSSDNPRNAMLKRFLKHVEDGIRQDLLSKGLHQQSNILRLCVSIPDAISAPAPTQSHRDPMPQHLVDLCIKILTENDYAWPKSSGLDWITIADPISKQPTTIWSPVRASVLIAKLMLPARTMQIRMLDSGEADAERYEPEGRCWAPNLNPMAIKSGKRLENGVFRAYPREDGSRGSLIYFNTNKTADANQPIHKRGHLMTWEHEAALQLFANLRNWQEQFNPLSEPTAWTDLSKQRCESQLDLAARGTACFLFRDPTNANPTLPISNGKVQIMWAKLMEEAERRLAQQGEKHPDGSPIQLVISRTNGMPTKLAYDLHSLRVTMITALYDSGVPVDRLMKVAGHCATMMTLYYVKESREKISQALTNANIKRQLPAIKSSEWNEFLARPKSLPESLTNLHSGAVQSTAAPIKFIDKGLCLKGSHSCPSSQGPGRSCVQCPHFASGPAFIPGLQAECGELFKDTCRASEAYQKAEIRVSALRLDSAQGKPGASSELDAAKIKLEQSAHQVDELSRSLIACHAWTKQCIELTTIDQSRPMLLRSSELEAPSLESPCSGDAVLSRLHKQAAIYTAPRSTPPSEMVCRLRFLANSLGAGKGNVGFGICLSAEISKGIAKQGALWAELRCHQVDQGLAVPSILEQATPPVIKAVPLQLTRKEAV